MSVHIYACIFLKTSHSFLKYSRSFSKNIMVFFTDRDIHSGKMKQSLPETPEINGKKPHFSSPQ